MMLRGTRVGQAYVSLVINGDGMDEEIVHSVEDAAPGVEKAGEDHGKRYSEEFNKEAEKSVGGDGKIWEPVGRDAEKAGEDSGNRFGDGADKTISQRMRATADKAGQALADRLASRSRSVQNGIERSFGDDQFSGPPGGHIGARGGGPIPH